MVLPLELQLTLQVGVALFEPGYVLLPRLSTKVFRSGRVAAGGAACAASRAR